MNGKKKITDRNKNLRRGDEKKLIKKKESD